MNRFEPILPTYPQSISLGASIEAHSHLLALLHESFPQPKINWTSIMPLKEIDTYILLILCPYGEEELPKILEGIQKAHSLIESPVLKENVSIELIFFRDIKVDFPERKLQREKLMSETISDQYLLNEAPSIQKRVHISHEFGKHDLQENLKRIEGPHLHFDLLF